MKNRLSKLQKWMLTYCYKNLMLREQNIKKYYGKRQKKWLSRREEYDPFSASERVTIHRSLKSLVEQGLLFKHTKYHNYRLTYQGHAKLKANEVEDNSQSVSFRKYQERVENNDKEFEGWRAGLKEMTTLLKESRLKN